MENQNNQVIKLTKFLHPFIDAVDDEFNRTESVIERKDNIISTRTENNFSLKNTTDNNTFREEFDRICSTLNVRSLPLRTGAVAFESMLITSGMEFFVSLGYDPETGVPSDRVKEFFRRSYAWAITQIGFRKTDRNIIAAKAFASCAGMEL